MPQGWPTQSSSQHDSWLEWVQHFAIHPVSHVLYKVVSHPHLKSHCVVETAVGTSWEPGIHQTETHNEKYEEIL